MTKYYYAGTTRVAMRQGSTLSYLLAHHPSLRSEQVSGSTSIASDASGNLIANPEIRYKG